MLLHWIGKDRRSIPDNSGAQEEQYMKLARDIGLLLYHNTTEDIPGGGRSMLWLLGWATEFVVLYGTVI